MFKKQYMFCIIFGLSIMLYGCMKMETSDKKVADMYFQVVDASMLPVEIQNMIEAKKESAFRMAYHEEEHSYIIMGYGMQETTGYRIQVNDVYYGENGVWVDTDLLGPKKSETVEKNPTYPYVVIQTEKIDQMIRFKS